MVATLPTSPPIPVKHKIYRKAARDLQSSLLVDFGELVTQRWITLVEPVREGLPALIAELQDDDVYPTYPNLVRNKRFLLLQQKFERQLPVLTGTVNKAMRKLIVESGEVGMSYAENLMKLYTSDSFKSAAMRDVAQKSLADYATHIGPGLADDVYMRSWAGLSKEMVENMRKGLPPDTIAKYAVDNGMSKGLNHIMLVARDQSLRAYREGDLAFFRNTPQVERMQRTASHDGRVCMMCLSLDGKIYAKTDTPPLHAQDRCDFLPILAGQEPYAWLNGDDWLKSQPESRQREILGPARYKLFKKGTPLGQFTEIHTHAIWGPTLREVPLGYFDMPLSMRIDDTFEPLSDTDFIASIFGKKGPSADLLTLAPNRIVDPEEREFLTKLYALRQKQELQLNAQQINRINARHMKYARERGSPSIAKMTDEEMLENFQAAFADRFGDADLVIRVPQEAVMDVLNSGRFKTQFETGTSRGSLAPGMRARAERKGIGLAEDLPSYERPIYGYLDIEGESHRASNYGNCRFVMKPEVRNRTTITYEDSLSIFLDDEAVASAITNPQPAMMGESYDFLNVLNHEMMDSPGSYLEMQVQGGVIIEDVARLEIEVHRGIAMADIEAAIAKAKSLGITDVKIIYSDY